MADNDQQPRSRGAAKNDSDGDGKRRLLYYITVQRVLC